MQIPHLGRRVLLVRETSGKRKINEKRGEEEEQTKTGERERCEKAKGRSIEGRSAVVHPFKQRKIKIKIRKGKGEKREGEEQEAKGRAELKRISSGKWVGSKRNMEREREREKLN